MRKPKSDCLTVALALIVLLLGASGVWGQEAANDGARLSQADIEHAVLFYLFGGTAAIMAVGVVFTHNIVRTAIFLLGTLISISLLYFLLMAHFLAVVQLIVYAGGILVLIVFGIMLTARVVTIRYQPSAFEVIAGATVIGVIFGGLVLMITTADWARASTPADSATPIAEFGRTLMSDYLIPFEVISLLLLIAMVGAAFLARPHR